MYLVEWCFISKSPYPTVCGKKEEKEKDEEEREEAEWEEDEEEVEVCVSNKNTSYEEKKTEKVKSTPLIIMSRTILLYLQS